MRKLTLIIFTLIFASIPFVCVAELPPSKEESNTIIILQKTQNKRHSKYPKSPDRQIVSCSYDGEGIELTFVYSEGISTLTITDDVLNENSYVIDTSCLNVYVPAHGLVGNIYIKLETEDGAIFEGQIEDNFEK